ncbi:unnamed protein product [Amoebophrya sp. A120]|nr:unnamed protein product [Amoebophrya sp. A120]|eukprot:GSA120T00002485001.1
MPGSKLTEENVRQMAEDCDRDGNGVISVDELFKAITQGSLVFNIVLKEVRGDRNAKDVRTQEECTRPQLVTYLRFQFTKNDACFSLPFTFVFFTCFLAWMGSHLEIRQTYELHAAIQNEISGEGGISNHEGPFLMRDVHDVPTFWDWFSTSFVNAMFRQGTNSELVRDFPVPGRLASFNQVIGGVGLQKFAVASEDCMQAGELIPYYDNRGSLITAFVDNPEAVFAGKLDGECQPMDGAEVEEDFGKTGRLTQWFLYQERISDMRAKADDLSKSVWLNRMTTKIRIRTLFYNAHYGMFTVMHLELLWRRQGLFVIRYRLTSFLADPYHHWTMYLLDLVYVLLLVKMMISESKELIPAIKNGVDGFFDYWEFWNMVDWLSILFGFVLSGIFWQMALSVSGPLRDHINKLPQVSGTADQMIHSSVKQTYLTPTEIVDNAPDVDTYEQLYQQLDDLHETADGIAATCELLRVFIGIYLLIIMLRFFKGFRANPRLEVVTRTIVDGSSDIAHFFVVFMTIFLAFMATAQTLFGSRIRAFSDLASSLNTGFAILLGDFDFQELIGQDGATALDFACGTLWFWLFQWSVTIIMFNILLAIVMNQFAKADAKQVGAETIIEQTFSTYRQMNETKGHLDIWYLLCEFEDDDDPAHPDKFVSARSLRRAFPRMSKYNSEYLVSMAIAHDASENEKEEEVTLTMACRMITKTLAYSKRASENMETLLDYMIPSRTGFKFNAGGGSSPARAGGPPHLRGPGGAPLFGGGVSGPPQSDVNQIAQSAEMLQMALAPTLLEKSGELVQSKGFDSAGLEKGVRQMSDFLQDRFRWLDSRFAERYQASDRVEAKVNNILRAIQQLTEVQERVRADHGRGSPDRSADWRRLRRVEDQVAQLEDQNTRILELVERIHVQMRNQAPRQY